MSKTAKRVLSMVLAVLMILSSMTVFAVAETAQAFADAYDGTVIPKTALLVDSGISAADVEAGTILQKTWDGKAYLFTAGTNAFNSFTAAYAKAKALGIARPAIIVTGWGATTEVVIEMASDVYAPNWNTAPMNEMTDDFDAIASEGADWTANTTFAANELKIGTITVNGDVQGSASINGFTLTKYIQADTKRNSNSTKFEFLIKNCKMSGVSTNGNILKNTGNTSTTNEDTITFKNFWLDTIGGENHLNAKGETVIDSRFFGDNTRHASHLVFDGLYVDMSKATFLKINDHLKSYAVDTSITFKNSNLRKSANSTSPYWNLAQMNKTDITEYTRTFTFDNNVMYNWTNGGPIVYNTAVSSKGANVINITDNFIINTTTARALVSGTDANFTITGNKLLGITNQTLANGTIEDNFFVSSLLADVAAYKAATGSMYSGSDDFYVDYNETISAADFTESFNDKLAKGLNVNGTAFTAADTVAIVSTANVVTLDGEKVSFSKFGNEVYKFVVDGTTVVELGKNPDLAATTALAGKKNIIFAAGDYDSITLLTTPANYYGANIGVDPIDKSGATAANNFDWALSDAWDLTAESELHRLTVPAGLAGTVVVDGFTITKDIADQARLITDGSLDITYQNILHDAPSSDATAVFYMHNARSINKTDAENGALNLDKTTIKNYFVKNHTSNQFLHETLNANVVIDNLYWNTAISGQKRSTLGFIKTGLCVANASFTIKNSNLRQANDAKSDGYGALMFYQPHDLDVTIENNIFYQGYAATSNAIYTKKEVETANFGLVKVNNNTFITTAEGAKLFGSASNGFFDADEGSEAVNNAIVGYAEANIAMGGLDFTPYYLDTAKAYYNTGIEIEDLVLRENDAFTVEGKDYFVALDGAYEATLSSIITKGNAGDANVTVTYATDSAFKKVIDDYDLSTLNGSAKIFVKLAYNDTYYNVYTFTIVDATVPSFNELLATKDESENEIGVTINTETFKLSDTAVYLPNDATVITVGGKQVTYLPFFGKTYQFVIDNKNVFANNGSNLSALAGFKGKKIVLPAGNYGELSITFAADFFGSNLGVNPSDKSKAGADNNWDWAFNTKWNKEATSVITTVRVAAGVSGSDLSFDGFTMSMYVDDARTLTDGALYAQVKNTRFVNAGNTDAVFFTDNKRTKNFTDGGVGDMNNDSLLVKNCYFESVKSRQLLHEFNVPNVTIEGIYLDGTNAGKKRPAFTFGKASVLNKSTFIVKDSNIRNAGRADGATSLFTFQGVHNGTSYVAGGTFNVEVTGNWIVNGQNGSGKLFAVDNSLSGVKIYGNTFITTSGEALYGSTNHGTLADEDIALYGNVTVDSNRFVGFTAANIALDAKYGTMTKTYYSSTLEGLTDGNANTGEYAAAMGENPYYLSFNKGYFNTGIEVDSVTSSAEATITDSSITLLVDGTPNEAITVDRFVTGNADGKEIVKTLATDEAFKNTVTSFNYKDLVGSKTLYLKVMYKGNEKLYNIYKVTIIDSNVEVFNDVLAEGLEIGEHTLTANDTAVWLSPEAQAEVVGNELFYEFKGTLYKFIVDGTTVVANNAFASIEKENVLLVAGNYGKLTVSRSANYIGENAGIDPMDPRSKDEASATNGYNWTVNADWDFDNAPVFGDISVAKTFAGDLLVDGVVFARYVDQGRTTDLDSIYTTIQNSVIDYVNPSESAAIIYLSNKRSTNTKDQNAADENEDTFTLYNVYGKRVQARQLVDEFVYPYVTLDGVYIDAEASGKYRSAIGFIKTGLSGTDFVLQNSNFRNGTDGNPFFAMYGAMEYDATNTKDVYVTGEYITTTVDNNIFYNANGSSATLLAASVSSNYEYSATNNTFIDTTGGAYFFRTTNYAKTAVGDSPLYDNIELSGNNIIGTPVSKGITTVVTDASYAFAGFGDSDPVLYDTFFSPSLACLEDVYAQTGIYHPAMGDEPYYLDLARSESISILDYPSFNELLAEGTEINNVEFSADDTIVVVPSSSENFFYGLFAGQSYTFEVDDTVIFDDMATALAAASAGTKVILPVGNYAKINVSKAVTFYGSNFGINPVDKTTATAENFFDWSFNTKWNEANSTNVAGFEVAAGVAGDLVVDGIKLTYYFFDTQRTTASGTLNTTIVNTVIENTAAGNAVFCLRNSRNEKNGDATFGANFKDTFTLKDSYTKKNGSNQFIDEFIPNVVLDGIYHDGAAAGQRRPALSWFKTAPANNVTVDIRNSNIRNGGTSNGSTELFKLCGNANSTSALSVTVENNILYNASGAGTGAHFAIQPNWYVTELNVLDNTFIEGDKKHNLISGYTAALAGNITVDGNRFVGFTEANVNFGTVYAGTELTNTYYSPNLTGITDPTAKTGEYVNAMGKNTYYLDFNMDIEASAVDTFVGNYKSDVISDAALLVDTTITEDEMATATDIIRDWEGQAYQFTTGVNAFSTLEAAFAKAVALGIDCPDIIVTSYDMSNGVGGETSPKVSNHNMNITMPCSIYGRKWNIAPMNEMNDSFNAIASENKDWTLNTQFVSTVDTIVPNDVTSVNHIFISNAVVGKVKFAGLRVLDQLHFGGLSGETKRTADSGKIDITVENTLLQIKPGKTWGGAVIDTMYAGNNAGVTNNDSLTFKNVWFKNIRKTELCGIECVPSTFVLDSVYMAMDHFTTHTFIKGNGTNVKHIYKDSYFAISEDDTCFAFGGGTTGIDASLVESAELVFENNVFNNYNDTSTTGMLDINPSAYTSIKFKDNFVFNTEDTPKKLFNARTAFGENVEVTGNVILGFRADDTFASANKTAPITLKDNFVVTKVCETLDEYKAALGTGFKTDALLTAPQTYFYDYARAYSNAGQIVTGIDANVTTALIENGKITLSVDGSSQNLTVNSFNTTNATKPVVKTLATDADFTNVIDSFDLASESATLYLKVAYADTAYPETVYVIHVFNDAGIPVFLESPLTINGVTFTKADTALYLPADTAMVGNVAYVEIDGTEYKVVVGDNASKDLNALASKKNILLLAANYGDILVTFAANFYGTNMNVNPFDKSGASAANNYDWALNAEWDMENVSLVREIKVQPGAKGGELVFDGVKFATYIDAYRTLEDDALYTTIKNSVLNNAVASTAAIHTDSERAKVVDATFGATYDDSFTLKDVYVEKTLSNQLIQEWNVPYVTLDGVYLDGVKAGKKRPIISFFKTTSTRKSEITVINSNFRNGGTTNGASQLFTVTGAVDRYYKTNDKGEQVFDKDLFPCVEAVEVVLNDNIIYNINSRVMNIYTHSISKVEFTGNIVIDETGKQGLIVSETTPKNVAGDVRGTKVDGTKENPVDKEYLALYKGEGVILDNNMLVGLNPDKMSTSIGLEEKNPEITNTYYSSTVEGLADATAKTGEKVYCMYDNEYYLTYDKKVVGSDVKLTGVSKGTSDATVRKYYEKTKSVEIRLGESGTTAGVVFSIAGNGTGTFVDAEGNYVDAVTEGGTYTYRVYSNVYNDVYEDYTVTIPVVAKPDEPTPDTPVEPEGDPVATVGGKEYTSVEAAIAAAEPGQTVQLTTDSTAENVVVTPEVTLDLNGKKLTADRVVGLEGSNVIDTDVNMDGGIIVAKENVILSKNNEYISVYDDTNKCYVFQSVSLVSSAGNDRWSFNAATYTYEVVPRFGGTTGTGREDYHAMFADGGATTGVDYVIRVAWTDPNGTYTATQDFKYTEEIVATYFKTTGYSGKSFLAEFTGQDHQNAAELTIYTVVKSCTGVEILSRPKVHTK